MSPTTLTIALCVGTVVWGAVRAYDIGRGVHLPYPVRPEIPRLVTTISPLETLTPDQIGEFFEHLATFGEQLERIADTIDGWDMPDVSDVECNTSDTVAALHDLNGKIDNLCDHLEGE